ncbi:bifunctional DNA primase/polymerase [Kutzneria sp. NPDC051319]|uniref:bifunctional DNA primase/polymerase n=1 Tax=Kutzneria sp. NPDC051319 TaxID=3155047 RepID=UPI0034367630
MPTPTPAVPGAAATVALWMATHHGWHVLPLNPGTKTPLGGCRPCGKNGDGHTAADCACLARGDGALCHGVWAATNDPDVITRWGRRWQSGVWALNLDRSGLIAVDMDNHGGTPPTQPLTVLDWPEATPPPADGIDVYATLAALHGTGLDTDHTLTTHTAGDGLHQLYRAVPGRWKGSRGKPRDDGTLPKLCLGWQVDVKAYGGYVVIPGSVTTAGRYERISTALDAAPMPAWLCEVLAGTGHDRQADLVRPAPGPRPLIRPVPGSGREGRYAAGALRSACDELADMAAGDGRNRKLFRSASRLAGMTEAGWIDRAQVENGLSAAAHACALPAGEIRYAIASGFRHPRLPHLRSAA